jgi:CMP-N,N'-diacetyllegionaminic acid synthase
MSAIAIIPARSGSKGLPGKNIRSLLGKPLIAWSIEQALASKYIGVVHVSTDSEEIASIARSYGAEVPFLRPATLATDTTSTADVLIHHLNALQTEGMTFDHLVLLEPTSPLRETSDIDAAFKKLSSVPQAKSIVGVAVVESQHPSFCVSLTDAGFLRSENDFKVLRRQDIQPLYYYEGSIYISEIPTFMQKKNFYHHDTLGHIFPKWKAFEIDDITDFIIVEALLKNKKNL